MPPSCGFNLIMRQVSIPRDGAMLIVGRNVTPWLRRRGARCEGIDGQLHVLFLDSQTKLLSDSQVHRLLIQSYDRNRVEVHVACNRGDRGTEAEPARAFGALPGVRLFPMCFGIPSSRSRVHLLGGLLSVLIDFAQLALYVRRNHIDIIHAASRPRDALYAVMLARLTGAQSVIHLHVKVSDWFGKPMRWALRRCSTILCISEFVARSACAAGYPASKVRVVLNSLEVKDWDPRADGAPVREESGIAPGVPLLAIVSRLFEWKGHSDLLRALALVREEEPCVKLLIVGEDDPLAHRTGGSYQRELEMLAHELDLTDNVVFTGFRRDIQRILSACDIYTMPSFEEPLGVAFLEAMAMRKPVVALASGGVPEVVDHGKSGLLSAPGDIEMLAKNILTLIKDADLRRQMGANGRLHVERHHDPSQLARKTETIYRRTST